MSEPQTVLLVGHCGPDSWALRTAVSRVLPGVAVELVHDEAELAARLSGASLLLVNRVLDGGFRARTGSELIAALAPQVPGVRFMLISNFPEAHEEALRAGAVPGFGKAEMYSPRARELIRSALGLPAN